MQRKLNIKQMLLAVAIAGWVAYNARLFNQVISDDGGLPSAEPSFRHYLFITLAWLISPAVSVAIAFFYEKRFSSDTTLDRVGDRVVGWMVAGFAGWFCATILLCVAHRANGQTPLVAIIMGGLGALLQVVPALIVGILKKIIKLI